jgi:hypothetical protein
LPVYVSGSIKPQFGAWQKPLNETVEKMSADEHNVAAVVSQLQTRRNPLVITFLGMLNINIHAINNWFP